MLVGEPTALPRDLLDGFLRFREGRYVAEAARYRRLAETGQRPHALVVACSDSRSAPEAVFDAGPGELFVVRNVAGLVPEFAPDAQSHGVSAALEYGVMALNVNAIVILGHGHCGGIASALDEAGPLTSTDFVGTWTAGIRDLAVTIVMPATASSEDRRLTLERRSVELSIEHVRTFPWIHRRVADGDLSVHGAWFDIALGELHQLGPQGWRRVDVAS
jgi:carbonic anhydrase